MKNRIVFLAGFLLAYANYVLSEDKSSIQNSQLQFPEKRKIATVNGQEVSIERFNRIYNLRISQIKKNVKNPQTAQVLGIKTSTAKWLIDELLIKQEAQRKHILISVSETDSVMQIFKRNFKDPGEARRFVESSYGGIEEMRDVIRTRLRLRRLANVDAYLAVSDEDALAYYRRNQFRYDYPEYYIVQHLFLFAPADTSAGKRREIEKTAQSIRDQAITPSRDFKDVIRKYSQNKRILLGDRLGRATKESVDPALWNALTRMKVGEISQVIQIKDGYCIMKVLDYAQKTYQPFASIKDSCKSRIRALRISGRMDAALKGLYATSTVTNHLNTRYEPYLRQIGSLKPGDMMISGLPCNAVPRNHAAGREAGKGLKMVQPSILDEVTDR